MKEGNYLIVAKILISVLMFKLCVSAQSKWQWQNPLPQGADMFAVFNLSPDRAIITGSGGTIMTTEDQGQNWHIQRLQQVDWVRRYSFISENEGWIIGYWFDITTNNSNSKIFKTNDGGLTWQELLISIDIDFSIYGLTEIEFIDNHTGYLLTNPSPYGPPEEQDPYPGLIYKTEDGGIHWTPLDIGISRKYHQIVFVDSLNGFLLSQPYYSDFDFEESLMHQTTNGGKTWVTLSGKGYGRINFVNDSIGWAGNYKTTDGGQTWQYQQFNFPQLENTVDKIWFTDSMVGYAISYRTILKTQDSGDSWTIQTETINGVLKDIQFYNSQIGYTCGYGGTVYCTSDGGENWTRCGKGTTADLFDIDFTDENTGWTVGEYGTILHTKDGGNIWEKQNIPAECDSIFFRAVDFLDSERGWIAGEKYILKTENGGNNWHMQLKVELEDASGRFCDIKFLDENIGFSVGRESLYGSGMLYKTIDAGINWQRVDEGNLPPLDEICFVDNDYGWICGWGILLSTKDGGNSWYTEYFPEFLRYMQFTDRDHGWISALDEGAFYRTTDGGKTWTDIPYENRFSHFFNSFFFFNSNYGIASTFVFCGIVISKDGGFYWSYEESLPPSRLNVMTFINNTIGWAVGTRGAILKFQGNYFKINDNVPTSADLAGNYPNPFNNKTTIYFYLSQPQEVSIAIYSVLGKGVETFSVSNPTKGKNEINWQPQNTATGLYLIKIHCHDFTRVIKCLFLK
jgi:photosystem II stability/assembly factor-like uncharacterized protein